MGSLATPPLTDQQILTQAAHARHDYAVTLAANGQRAEAARAELDARVLYAHAAYSATDGIAGRRPPGNRHAVLTFARAVLGGGPR